MGEENVARRHSRKQESTLQLDFPPRSHPWCPGMTRESHDSDGYPHNTEHQSLVSGLLRIH